MSAGGEILSSPTEGVPVRLSRGLVVMSRASLAALSPDMRERLFADSDIITAEDALAQLDEDEA